MAIAGLALTLALLLQASPQNPTQTPLQPLRPSGAPDIVEDVVVNAPGAERIEAFAGAFLEPARLGRNAGQIARWTDKLCVRVIGAAPEINDGLGDQIKDVFRSLGAPVEEGYCRKPNVMVVIADNANGFARVFANRYSNRMFANRRGDMDAFVGEARPVRWQHRTRTVPRGGRPLLGSLPGFENAPVMELPQARLAMSTAEEVDRAMIVVDPRRLGDAPSRGLAAYIAFATLIDLPLQPDATGRDTILNLFEPGGPTDLTKWDRALIAGVYAMTPSQPFRNQQDQIERTMRRTLTLADPAPGLP